MIDANRDYMLEVAVEPGVREAPSRRREACSRRSTRCSARSAEIISGSEFGQDAIKKARTVCDKARQAIAVKDVKLLLESTESLGRTLNMFRGVVSKTRADNAGNA